MEISLKINDNVSKDEWIPYVKNHPDGTIYHLPAWKEILEESFNYTAFYIFARDENKKLCGILPLFQVKSIITGNRMVSLPFSYICGATADSEFVEKELLNEAKRICQKKGCKYLEIRSIKPKNIDIEASNYFFTYIVNLSSDVENIRKIIMDKRSIRRAINKSKMKGVKVMHENTMENLKVFNELNQKTHKKLGVPAHPFSFLKNIYQKMHENMELYLAEIDGKIISGVFTLNFKDTVLYAYGASDEKYLKYYPNNLLIWEAIEYGCKNGYKYFDFGRASQDNIGLIDFKKSWGSEEKKLFYYYYPKKLKTLSTNRESSKYKIATSAWKKIPVQLSEPLSNMLFKHFD